MKDRFVVCIDDDFHTKPYPIKGEICEVEKAGSIKGETGIYYYLKGYDYKLTHSRVAFNSVCFRPIANMDVEIELMEEVILKAMEYETALNP